MPVIPVLPLPAAVSGERRVLAGAVGELSYYVAGPDGPSSGPPLLLVHSVNAAASAREVAPLYEHYRATRAVYALDLPGYGFSERSDRFYTPRLMTDALHALVDEIAARHGAHPIDAIAVSLSCEFLARSATERPAAFRSVALVSATALDRDGPFDAPPGTTRGKPWLLRWLGRKPWSEGLFRTLTRPSVIRFFLQKTWGSKHVDEGLVAYDIVTARQPGASFAPFHFLSAFLFSADITPIYHAIPAPVWLVHGTRGDFTDYRYAPRLASSAGWSIHVMPAGAMPYFEDLSGFVAAYETFLRARVAIDGAKP